MNGVVFQEIGKLTRSLLGEQAWADMQRAVAPRGRVYYRVADCPDWEATALVATLAEQLHEPADAVLRRLGEFMVPDLVRMARYWIPLEWRTLDLILHTEAAIHETLRDMGSRTDPPRLRTRRIGPHEVEVLYDSPRRLCALAKGIVAGLGKHCGEETSVTESACLLAGAPACRLVVSVVPRTA